MPEATPAPATVDVAPTSTESPNDPEGPKKDFLEAPTSEAGSTAVGVEVGGVARGTIPGKGPTATTKDAPTASASTTANNPGSGGTGGESLPPVQVPLVATDSPASVVAGQAIRLTSGAPGSQLTVRLEDGTVVASFTVAPDGVSEMAGLPAGFYVFVGTNVAGEIVQREVQVLSNSVSALALTGNDMGLGRIALTMIGLGMMLAAAANSRRDLVRKLR